MQVSWHVYTASLSFFRLSLIRRKTKEEHNVLALLYPLSFLYPSEKKVQAENKAQRRENQTLAKFNIHTHTHTLLLMRSFFAAKFNRSNYDVGLEAQLYYRLYIILKSSIRIESHYIIPEAANNNDNNKKKEISRFIISSMQYSRVMQYAPRRYRNQLYTRDEILTDTGDSISALTIEIEFYYNERRTYGISVVCICVYFAKRRTKL